MRLSTARHYPLAAKQTAAFVQLNSNEAKNVFRSPPQPPAFTHQLFAFVSSSIRLWLRGAGHPVPVVEATPRPARWKFPIRVASSMSKRFSEGRPAASAHRDQRIRANILIGQRCRTAWSLRPSRDFRILDGVPLPSVWDVYLPIFSCSAIDRPRARRFMPRQMISQPSPELAERPACFGSVSPLLCVHSMRTLRPLVAG